MKVHSLLSFVFFLACTSIVHADDIKLGVSLPLTGPASTYGTDIKNILTFLRDREKRSDIEFIFEDDKCDPKEATAIAQKFTTIDKITAQIGLPCSGAMVAAAPIYERAKTLAFSVSAGSPTITNAGDYIFRFRPSDIHAGSILAKHFARHYKSVAILAEETDFASMLTKLRSQTPEALVVLSQTERSLLSAVHSLRQLHWDIPLFSSLIPGSPSFLKAAGAEAEGIIFTTVRAKESFDSEGESLLQEFEVKYGPMLSVDYVFPTTYAAFRSLSDALTKKDPKTALYSTTYRGLGGDFHYDTNGDLQGMSFVLKKIVSGKPIELLSQS